MMKHRVVKKGIAMVLIGSMLLSFSGCGKSTDAAALEIPDFIVEVESGREPIILQLTDPQIVDAAQARSSGRLPEEQKPFYATNMAEENCYKYLREIITETKPDLILMTGDLVYGEFDDKGTALTGLIEFMESFKIPWAPVMGNHEGESTKGADWQCEQLENAKHCLFKQRDIMGNGNYTVGIKQDKQLKRVFFMLDSNGCTEMSVETWGNCHTTAGEGFTDGQIAWYTDTANQIKELSPDTKFSFAFHIPMASFADAYAKYGFTNSGTEENPIDIDSLKDGYEDGENDFGYIGGDIGGWDADGEIFEGIAELGTDSIFVGHKHAVSASVVKNGIRFQIGQKSSAYDKMNYKGPDGDIVSTYYTSAYADYKPIVGGTVIPLSAEDGAIKEPYIYYCK